MGRTNRPRFRQRSPEVQAYGTLANYPLGLPEEAKERSCELLNQALADTMTIRDMYKKHHWQVSGPTFYALHLLFDKHFEQQAELVDTIAERIQLLGGIALAMPHDVAEATHIARAPKGREAPPVQISRLLEAHETILKHARNAARQSSQDGDEGTNDLFVSEIIRTNEMQVWFLTEHLVPTALVDVSEGQYAQGTAPGEHAPSTPH